MIDQWIIKLFGSQQSRISRFCKISAMLAGLFGAFVLLAGGFRLSQLIPPDIPISDGGCFVMLALCLWFQAAKPGSGSRRSFYQQATSALGLATVSVALFFFLRSLAITEASGMLTASSGLKNPPGTPHLAALDFILLGAAFALPEDDKHDQALSTQLLAGGSFVLSLLGLLAFSFSHSTISAGALVETLLLIALSLGVFFLHPDRGVVAEIFTGLSGGVMARRLLPIAIVIPVVLDWWRYEAQKEGLLNSETGTMLMVMMAIILLLYEMIVTAQRLNRADESRRRTEEALADANETLETKVAERSAELNEANTRLRSELAERMAAEERLRRTERHLRVILDQIPAVVWTTDRGLRILSASGTALAAANLRAEDLIGKTVHEFLGATDEDAPPATAHRAVLDGQPRTYEIELAGRSFSAHLEPLHDREGNISGVIGVALDVTEEKKAQQSAAKLAAIVESSQDAIMGTTLDGIFTSWNLGAVQMYGYKEEEVLGQQVSITVPPNRKKEVIRTFEKVKRGERVPPFETVRLRKDGRLIDVSLAISPVKNLSGKTVGVSAIAHDISERKRIERELRKLSGRLLKMQDEERRNIARELHDGAIQGLAASVLNLSMIKESDALPAESAKALEEALKLTRNAVQEIRTFSYLLHPPLLEVTGLASTLRWYVEGYSRRSGIKVNLHLQETGCQISKEVELALFRIVQESLTNIHRHSGGSEATIRLEQTPEDGVTLFVADNGNGMDQSTLEKVQSKGAPLGVGIAGMKERLRQLGGYLKVSSNGSGTVVCAALPLLRNNNETVARVNR